MLIKRWTTHRCVCPPEVLLSWSECATKNCVALPLQMHATSTSIDVKPPRIFQFLNLKVRATSAPSRRFNAEDSRFITEPVNKMIDQGIIESSESPWRTQILVTKDERHTRRMVIDCSQTINRFPELDVYSFPKIDRHEHKLAKCNCSARLFWNLRFIKYL